MPMINSQSRKVEMFCSRFCAVIVYDKQSFYPKPKSLVIFVLLLRPNWDGSLLLLVVHEQRIPDIVLKNRMKRAHQILFET